MHGIEAALTGLTVKVTIGCRLSIRLESQSSSAGKADINDAVDSTPLLDTWNKVEQRTGLTRRVE